MIYAYNVQKWFVHYHLWTLLINFNPPKGFKSSKNGFKLKCHTILPKNVIILNFFLQKIQFPICNRKFL